MPDFVVRRMVNDSGTPPNCGSQNVWRVHVTESSMEPRRPAVLITGSSGLIGSALARRLARRFTVVGVDQPGAPHPPTSADCIDVDLASERSLQEGLELVRDRHGSHIASVIHLAAYYDFSGQRNPL